MKKFIVLSLLFLISSCSLFNKTSDTFEGYYVRNVDATIESLDKTLESLGFFRSIQSSGIVDAALSIPVILSGSLRADYGIKSDGRNMSFEMKDTRMQYDGLAGSGSLSLETLSLISQAGDLYIFYKNLEDVGFSTPDMREVFSRFDNKWLSWTQAETRAGITDPTELEAMNLADNLSKLNKKQIQKYLTTYPIWKSTADLGMSGALHMYSVELDQENILAMMNTVRKDLMGTGFSSDEQEALREQLKDIRLAGTMGFHTKDTDITQVNLSFGDAENDTLGTLLMDTSSTGRHMVIMDTVGGTQMTFDMVESDDKYTLDILVSQSGAEIAKITGYIDGTDDAFRELALDITAQGISATLKHTQKEDGKFEGRLTLPVGSISWNGNVDDKKLMALKVLGASPAGSFDLDLVPEGDMIRGPFVLRMGGEEVVKANIGLTVEPSIFRMSVDVPQGEDDAEPIHAEMGWTTKISPFLGSIKTPSPTTPLQTMIEELDALTSTESQGDPQGIQLDPELSFDEMDDFDPAQ